MSGDPLRDLNCAARIHVFGDSRGRLDYTQPPLALSANRRATGRPPSVASALTCFPDADPTMTQRDRPLHS